MKLDTVSHVTEEYFCSNCNKFWDFFDVFKNWKCPKCGDYLQIRIVTKKLDNACLRIPVNELKIDDMILVHREDDFRSLLDLKDEGKTIRVAIKEYRALNLDKDSTVLILNGVWNHS
jgi:DNA-directed RNA polymerase subunit RPC12/RpoP